MPVDALLARDDIQIVVNLTIPAAHGAVSLAALSAGKHVFSEKPLAVDAELGRKVVAEAESRNLMVGCAPDTFLGAGGGSRRKLIDEGAVGTILTGTAFLMSHGMEHWHPDPEFFFKTGGGPVLDVGVYYITALVNLLGPVARVHSAITHRVPGADRHLRQAEARATASRSRRPPPAWRCLNSRRRASSPSARHGTSGSTAIRRSSSTARKARCACPIRISTAAWSRPAGRTATGCSTTSQELPLGKPQLSGRRAAPRELPRARRRRHGAGASRASARIIASGKLALHVLEVMEAVVKGGDTSLRRPSARRPSPRATRRRCSTRPSRARHRSAHRLEVRSVLRRRRCLRRRRRPRRRRGRPRKRKTGQGEAANCKERGREEEVDEKDEARPLGCVRLTSSTLSRLRDGRPADRPGRIRISRRASRRCRRRGRARRRDRDSRR